MPKLEPTRTCVGCRSVGGQVRLIRFTRRAEGGASMDITGRAMGRGAYLHHDPECIETARKRRALERALRTAIQPELWAELSGEAGVAQVSNSR